MEFLLEEIIDLIFTKLDGDDIVSFSQTSQNNREIWNNPVKLNIIARPIGIPYQIINLQHFVYCFSRRFLTKSTDINRCDISGIIRRTCKTGRMTDEKIELLLRVFASDLNNRVIPYENIINEISLRTGRKDIYTSKNYRSFPCDGGRVCRLPKIYFLEFKAGRKFGDLDQDISDYLSGKSIIGKVRINDIQWFKENKIEDYQQRRFCIQLSCIKNRHEILFELLRDNKCNHNILSKKSDRVTTAMILAVQGDCLLETMDFKYLIIKFISVDNWDSLDVLLMFLKPRISREKFDDLITGLNTLDSLCRNDSIFCYEILCKHVVETTAINAYVLFAKPYSIMLAYGKSFNWASKFICSVYELSLKITNYEK